MITSQGREPWFPSLFSVLTIIPVSCFWLGSQNNRGSGAPEIFSNPTPQTCIFSLGKVFWPTFRDVSTHLHVNEWFFNTISVTLVYSFPMTAFINYHLIWWLKTAYIYPLSLESESLKSWCWWRCAFCECSQERILSCLCLVCPVAPGISGALVYSCSAPVFASVFASSSWCVSLCICVLSSCKVTNHGI